jgi:hypothetical protein
VQVDQRYQDERKTGRGKTRRPIVHAKFQEGKHGAPVVESGLLQPGMAPQHRGDIVTAGEHLPRDLRIPGLIGPYQAKAIPPENGHQSIEQEKRGKNEKADGLQGVAQPRETIFQRLQTDGRPMKYSRRSQHCFFLNHRFCQGVGPRLHGLQQGHGYKEGCKKKRTRHIELRPQGYQIHRPGEWRTRCRMKHHEKRGRRLHSREERGSIRHRSAEILENPFRGHRQWAVQGATAGIFVTAAAKPLRDGGHVHSALAAQAEADAMVA